MFDIWMEEENTLIVDKIIRTKKNMNEIKEYIQYSHKNKKLSWVYPPKWDDIKTLSNPYVFMKNDNNILSDNVFNFIPEN